MEAEVIDAFPGVLTPELEGVIPAGDGAEIDAIDKLFRLASRTGDFSEAIDLDDLLRIGAEVCDDYEKDNADRREWLDIAKEALRLASQEQSGRPVKSYPWTGCADVSFPLITTAALQFNARAYPAIVKGDEAISVKVVGQDRGRPQLGPDGQPLMGLPAPEGLLPVPPEAMAQMPPEVKAALQPVWAVPPGGKASRARRVGEYLNTVLFYRMQDWETDTDSLLIQLPIIGCAFRKVWHDAQCREQKAAFVSALRIVVPQGARSCDTTPRLTEEIPDVFPHEIAERQRSGFYRDVIITVEGEETKGRLLLEQHRMMDLDEDGLEEPYIVTVDHETRRVLRIEANFGPDDVKLTEEPEPRVLSIKRGRFYVKYDFFPHPQGKFYGLGLGHLLSQLGEVINTSINQIMDTGAAQAAGGGFIASGVRLQARGSGSSLRFAPGEYKVVDVPGDVLRNALVERTLPSVSPVTFQVLDLIMGAARDIAGVKDVITGDASNMGQVGTTLALIEQGLQVFNSVYKRIYRALKEEFTLIYRNVAKFGGEEAARDYAAVMDDPAADFEADFNQQDMDIRPVSDPASVTRMQKMARAQALLGTAGTPGANPVAILKRVYEAMDVENPEELLNVPQAPAPDPKVLAEAQRALAQAGKAEASADRDVAEAERTRFETLRDATALGVEAGLAA